MYLFVTYFDYIRDIFTNLLLPGQKTTAQLKVEQKTGRPFVSAHVSPLAEEL